MAYDRRGYYYRSVRDGDRVRRVYLGRGPAAQLAALLVEGRRSERRERSLAWRAEEARWEAAAARRRAPDELGETLARAALLAAGYHRHDRGAWRRRRMNGDGAMNGMGSDPGDTPSDGAAAVPREGPARGGTPPVDGPDPGDRPPTEAEVRELIGRATRGDRAVLPALRLRLDVRPALWQLAGDIGRTALADWIDLVAGRDLLVRESRTRSVAALEAQVAGPAPAPLERLLAERVVAGWLQVSHADAAFARLRGQGATAAQLELMQRRQERTQKSYLAAIKTLATVRRLGVAAAPAATIEEAAGEVRSRRGRPDGGRARRVEASPMPSETDGGAAARGGRKRAGEGKPAGREAAVPKALRDRMRGLAAAEN